MAPIIAVVLVVVYCSGDIGRCAYVRNYLLAKVIHQFDLSI